MKKIIIGIVALIYIVVSSGIAMDIHYCMGKKAGVDFYSNGSDICGKCGMEEDKTGCCHDEHQFVKLSDSHQNVYNTISFASYNVDVINSFPFIELQLPTQFATSSPSNHSPPYYNKPDACIMNCVFRI